MSKPLELTIFPRLERPRTGAEIMPYREQWRREAALQGSKHLTAAELAAEYHSAAHDFDMDWVQTGRDEGPIADIFSTISRFARFPHYDEVDK